MPEYISTGATITKEQLAARLPDLRVELVNAQYDLREADFPVLVVIAGPDQTGINELVNRLNEWMDARYTNVTVLQRSITEQLSMRVLQRAWTRIPAKGEMAVFAGGYAAAVLQRVLGRIDDQQLESLAHHQRQLEEALVADGGIVVKLWLQISRQDLKQRLKSARKNGRGPVDRDDAVVLEHYDDLMAVANRYARMGESPNAPWLVIESADHRYRDLTAAETILASIRLGLDRPAGTTNGGGSRPRLVAHHTGALDDVDLSLALEYDEYKRRQSQLQNELGQLANEARRKGRNPVLVFEGWDAAGKGGAIRRITSALEVGDYRVVPISAPTQEELAHHYLWRFWRRLSDEGEMVIFDRSWYGRVLVERVEGFATEAEWRRAYGEIVDFEEQLVELGWPVCKFWLHIDPEEQQRRFQQRMDTPYKKYKITEEDLRNRDRWEAYVPAVNEMVARTSWAKAPWTLVPANDKRYARVKVLETVVEALRRL